MVVAGYVCMDLIVDCKVGGLRRLDDGDYAAGLQRVVDA